MEKIQSYRDAANLILSELDASVLIVKRAESLGCSSSLDILLAELRLYLKDELILQEIAYENSLSLTA